MRKPQAHRRSTPAFWLFWGSVGLLVYTYIGFPLLVLLRGLIARQRQPDHGTNAKSEIPPLSDADLPAVNFVIAAYNEADVIRQKIDNALSLAYPAGCLTVIVASDGSNDGTNQIVASYENPRVRLLDFPRLGKNQVINRAVAQTEAEILVFTDADSMLEPDALRYLVAPFRDPAVGGVAGSYHYVQDARGGEGERAYWRFDRKLKELQSQAESITGATGHIYAIRRALFEPVPPGVTDDAYISRTVIQKHKRFVFASQAIARGPIADAAGEYRRKVRVTTRGLRCVWEQKQLLNPLEYGFYSLQLFSHKVLRRLMLLPLLVTVVTAPLLWSHGLIYRLASLAQLALHSAAGLGYLLRDHPVGKSKVLSFPYHLDMVNLTGLIALINLLRGQSYDVWKAERATDEIQE
ncbi:MAG TPA: glycosyltransferase family 2 protein [Anaerolineales bacterium]|nr:glycosyltransferase family 2 protein [Anaerolineales bacterium]